MYNTYSKGIKIKILKFFLNIFQILNDIKQLKKINKIRLLFLHQEPYKLVQIYTYIQYKIIHTYLRFIIQLISNYF